MRELKFRAWDGKEMYYDVFIKMNQVYRHFNNNFKTEVLLWVHNKCGHITVAEKGWIMQWTGLKDKNGKDIYEGDIIKMEVTGNKKIHGEFAFYEVIFRNGLWMKSYLKSEKGIILPKGYTVGELLSDVEYSKEFFFSDNYFEDGISNIEVIGNVFENKGGLKDGK